jgi:hypothetical protein
MSTIEISTAMRCDRYDRVIRSDRTFQFNPSAIKEMLLVWCSCVLFRSDRCLGLRDNAESIVKSLKERGEYSVLALYSGCSDDQSFKDENRLCQRSLVVRGSECWKE